MDYITYFIKQNNRKSNKEILDLYLETLDMDKPGEYELANAMKIGIFYIVKSRSKDFQTRFNVLKQIMEGGK